MPLGTDSATVFRAASRLTTWDTEVMNPIMMMMANIIMIGFITSVTQVVSLDAARKTVAESVPKGTEEMNLTAFGKGYDYGLSRLKGQERKAAGKTGAMS